MARREESKHVVRPRWTWLGLAVLMVGVVVLGLGVIVLSWVVSGIGIAAIAVGGVAVLRGGLLYDTAHGSSPSDIIEKVKSGETHEAPGPDSLLGDARLRQDVAMESRRNELVRSGQTTVMPVAADDKRSVGGGLLIGIGLWLALGSIWIYPTSIAGQFGSTRDAFFGFIAAAAGLRINLGNGPSWVASGFAVLAGLFMLAFGLLADHSSWGAQLQEIGCGLLILVGAALASRR